MSSLRRNGERAVVYKKCTSVVENGIGTGRPPHVSVGAAKPLKERLQGITNAMGWIKEELVDLKESDRALMKIFKQLEGDVSEMTDMFSWRLSSSPNYKHTSMRPQSVDSVSKLESLVSHDQTREPSLESTLTSSKEELVGGEEESTTAMNPSSSTNGSDSLFTANEGSPCPLAKNASSTGSSSPPLKGSASLNKIANSPSIQRIQDDNSSNISRNSSIDSGIQFEHEHMATSEGSAAAPAPVAVTTEAAEGLGTSFANDIFATLGFS